MTVSVEDGTEEDDSDSHIMVWTLPESGNIPVSVPPLQKRKLSLGINDIKMTPDIKRRKKPEEEEKDSDSSSGEENLYD